MKKTSVQLGSSDIAEFFKPLLGQFSALFKRSSIFSSDEATMWMITCNGLPSLLDDKERLYVVNEIHKSFNVKINPSQLDIPLKEFLPWFSKQKYSFNQNYIPNNFLGIRNIVDHENSSWNLSYFFGIKDQFEYLQGFVMNKQSPLGKELIWKSIVEDVDQMKRQLFEVNPNHHFLITTEEGDRIICNNISEVCSWVIARGSNYSQSGKKEDW